MAASSFWRRGASKRLQRRNRLNPKRRLASLESLEPRTMLIATLTIAATDSTAAESSQSTGQFTITRTVDTSQMLMINYSLSGSASSGDYTGISSPLVMSMGQSSLVITITPTLDNTVEGNETLTFTITTGTGYSVGSPSNDTITISDDPPVVTIAATDSTAAEASASTGQFTVTRSGGKIADSLQIAYAATGTATGGGTDYNNLSSPLTISGGQTTGTLTVTPVADNLVEGSETVIVTITSGGYTIGSPNNATVTIADDPAIVTLTANDTTATEAGQTTGQFTVSRSGGKISDALSVAYAVTGTATGGGSDYSSLTNPISISAGQTTNTITITPVNDMIQEGNETVILTLSSSGAYTIGSPDTGTVTIEDRAPLTTITDVSISEPDSGTVNAVFTVGLWYAAGHTITVDYATANGTGTASSDYTSTTGQLVFTAGQTSKTVSVPIIADASRESFETFYLNLTVDPTNNAGDVQGLGTILDNSTYGPNTKLADMPSPVAAAMPSAFGQNTRVSDLTGSVSLTKQLASTGIALHYESASNDRPIITVDTSLVSTASVPDSMEAQLTFNGVPGTTVYYSTAGLSAGDPLHFALQADATGLATGRYAWQMSVRSKYGADTSERIFSGHQVVVNRGSSEFGKGWGVEGLDRLVSQTGGKLLVRGDGVGLWYASNGGGYTRPDGDLAFTTLVLNGNGTYTLTDKSGNESEFSSLGLLTSRIDRHGNETTFSYIDADSDTVYDELHEVTDPVGRVTTLTYATGRLSYVDDFDSRRTNLAYDSGRLITVTEPDPDGGGALTRPETAYDYDGASFRLSEVIDAASRTTGYSYDFAGRLDVVTHPDESTSEHDAVQTQGLIDLNEEGTELEPADLVAPSVAIAQRVDANSNSTQVTTDRFGNVATETNDLGKTTTFEHNSHGQVISILAPDPDDGGELVAPETVFTYDGVGNMLTQTLPNLAVRTWEYDATWNVPSSYIDELDRMTLYEIDAETGDMLSMRQVVGLVDDLINEETDDLLTTFTYTPAPGDEYDPPAGMIASIVDALGNETQFEYTPHGMLERRTEAVGTGLETYVEFEYNGADELTATIDELGRRTEYTRDALGRITLITFPDPDGAGEDYESPTIEREYDELGRLLLEIDPLGRETTYEYNNDGLEVVVTRPDHDEDTYLTVTTMVYDSVGNLLSVTDAIGRTIEYGYDELNRRVTVTLPDQDGEGEEFEAAVYTTVYDNLGRVIQTLDPDGNATDTVYDEMGFVSSVTLPDPDGVGGQSRPETHYTYDPAGNVLTILNAMEKLTTFHYDELGRKDSQTDPDPDGAGEAYESPVTLWAYDALGRVQYVTDPLENVTEYVYDERGRLTDVYQPDPDAGGGLSRPHTEYTYDDAGNRLTLVDPVGNTTTWVYDDLNRVTSETNEDSDDRLYVYDEAGNVIEKTDRNGFVTEYEYDTLNHLMEERWMDGESILRTISYVYNAADELIGVSDPDSEYAYEYDPAGHLVSVDNDGTPDVARVILTSGYDVLGRRIELAANVASNDDFLNTFVYDGLSRLTSVRQTEQVGGNSVADKGVDFSYNALGQFDAIVRYTDFVTSPAPDVATSVFGYDELSRLTALTHSHDSSTITGYDWTYDDGSRVTQYDSTVDGTSDYTYDHTNQVIDVDHSFQSDEAYAFDENGNRTNGSYSTDSNNKLASDGTFTYGYDFEGNRISKTRISGAAADDKTVLYTWDYRNRLTGVTFKNNGGTVTKGIEYVYDVFNRRIGKIVDADGAGGGSAVATRWILDGDHIVLALTGTSTLANRYLHGPAIDQILADEQIGGDVLWALTDNLGSVRDLVDNDGAVQNHIKYDAFGKVTSESYPAVDHLFGFTGRDRDEETGLQYNRARYYDSAVGRWLSEDPLGFSAGDENLFRYVRNSTPSAIDPSGLWTFSPGFGLNITFFVVHVNLSYDVNFGPGGISNGVTFGTGPAVGLGAAVGPQFTVTNATNVGSLGGSSGAAGVWGAVGPAGGSVEYVSGPGYQGACIGLPFFSYGLGGGIFALNNDTVLHGNTGEAESPPNSKPLSGGGDGDGYLNPNG